MLLIMGARFLDASCCLLHLWYPYNFPYNISYIQYP